MAFILKHYGRDIPAGVCFHFELAGDILREETFALLEQAPPGAFQLEIGMQSFCEKTLAAVRRKTDTGVLKQNIRRLVAMGNMHVHIDLIAGLPHEDLRTFGESFNTGYALGAQMLQLGFLKLLHGAAMRSRRNSLCFSEDPPYEVQKRPGFRRRAGRAARRRRRAGALLQQRAFLKRRLTRWRRQGFPRSFLLPFGRGRRAARHGEYSAG
ncbi:MAG: hypothetical protein ACLRZH_14360 [Ruthenibacterium lactatiformans]